VLEAIRPLHLRPARPARHSVAEEPAETGETDRRTIRNLLGPTPVPVDELVRQSGLPPATVQLVLLELELAGHLARHAGGKVSLNFAD